MENRSARLLVGPTALLTTLTLLAFANPGHGQSDNFNDGDDAGWTRVEPLAPLGAGGTFTFPNGGYRLQAASSPDPATLGSGRVGSLRADANYSAFTVSIDLVDWNNALDQAVGPMARISNLGLGTTDGYGFLYYVENDIVGINRFDNEQATLLSFTALTLNPANDYRFIFTGADSLLTGQVFALSDLSTPLATVSTLDGSYASGNPGILAAAVVGTASTADATFDNFAAVPEPSALALLSLGGAALLMGLKRRRVLARK